MDMILQLKTRIVKATKLTALLLPCLFCCQAVKDDNSIISTDGVPVYKNFVYQGNDQIYTRHPLKTDEFYSPILQGCYPDPSITHKGDDYYLVNSSFSMFPGVPIFHSKDLVNWKQIGHVLDRESQLKVTTAGVSAGIYAPDIMYNRNNDTFYMITTQIASGIGNMVVKTKDPAKGWSDPIKLKFDGIDPALFFDEDGKAYVVHNDAPEKGKELYQGHRVIKIWEYDIANDQIVAGSDQVIVDGGVDIDKKPIWIEGPHLYKKNGKYYLMCAEGGTGSQHSEVVFVSNNVKGPYQPAPKNPILSQRHLAKDRLDKVEWTGHADLVEGPGGQYFGVFLGVRPNQAGRVNIGRETFILPVDWTGEFPVFKWGLDPLKPTVKMPAGVSNRTGTNFFFPNGNFTFTDSFSGKGLDLRWVGLRGPREAFAEEGEKGLKIKPFAVNINEVKPTSTLFYRQQHNQFSASVELDYTPRSEKDLAGITCLQSEKFHYVFGVTKISDHYYLLLQRTEKGVSTVLASAKLDKPGKIKLKVGANGDKYEFAYAESNAQFKNLGGTVSGDILSTDVAGGFTGALIGLYATQVNDIRP
jgi:alpha-N-arabinofuranosidase